MKRQYRQEGCSHATRLRNTFLLKDERREAAKVYIFFGSSSSPPPPKVTISVYSMLNEYL